MSDDFMQEMSDMGGVKPLKQDKAELGKSSDEDVNLSARRQAALSNKSDDNHLSDHVLRELGPHDIVEFKRDGIQEGVFRKLRLGKYDIDARLDMHRMKLEEARQAVYQFIRDSMEYDLRSLLILHGKGFHSDETNQKKQAKAVLKSYTVHWLEDIDDVMAFHSAQPHHGGTGALYVLLRKSERAKQQNRERHGQK